MGLVSKALAITAIVIISLIAILTFNTLRLTAEPLAQAPLPPPPIDQATVQRLAAAIRIPTISTEAGSAPDAVLLAFHAHLAASFPRAHARLRLERVAGHSLLFTWPGTDPSAPALLLAAHQDVVPIEGNSAGKWTHPPFDGHVGGGFVWGRGTLDDKGSLMAILEAVERQLARGFAPRQTIYLAFGHDEERGGTGAKGMAALLKQRGVRIGLALDEGLAVLDGVVPGVKPPVALIGLSEKGYVSVELTATGAGGHSSMPTDDNAAVRIARAVERLSADPFPARVEGLTGKMLDVLAPHMDLGMRMALANRWLTGRLVERQLLGSPDTAAALRTTTAATIIQAGTKDNVLPQSARAVVNHRILPGDTINSVLARDRAVIDDSRVTVRAIAGGQEASKVADASGPDFAWVKAAARATFPNAVVAPGMMIGATDGRAYQDIARSVMRFMPIRMTKADLARFHGNDERVAIEDYARAIQFYERLITAAP